MKSPSVPALRPSARLDGLPGYGRGRAADAPAFAHRLGSNEAPEGPSPAVLAAAAAAMADANRYPDLRGETLAAALAARHGLAEDQVAVGAGSIVLLDQLIRAYCDPGDDVVTPWRSYEAYPIIAGLAGAALIEVPLDGACRTDVAALVAAIGPRCRAVLICNPNNPTGTALPPAEVDALIAALPSDVLVILDEAYADYAAPADAVAGSPAARLARHPNLAILRTFSKAWGLAGLRVGYCLAQPAIIAAVQAVQPPFPLPAPALAAALAALGDEAAVAARITRAQIERARLTEGARALGLAVADSAANFVWLPLGAAAQPLAAHLSASAIAARLFPGEGLRITTGTPADTDAVLSALRGWNARGSQTGR